MTTTISFQKFSNFKFKLVMEQWQTLGGGEVQRRMQDPPIIFTEALVLKGGSTRKFLFQ